MANKKLTDLTELTTPADNDFLYIVDVSDTTESAQGTSKKIRKDKVDSGASKENIANKSDTYTTDTEKYYSATYINEALPTSYSKIVYVNATSPTTATIFDLENPPVTNDNLLKNDTANLYIGTDASTWVYLTGTGYVTKTISSATSNFYNAGTTIDAGNSKTSHITRSGNISTTGKLASSGATTLATTSTETAYIGTTTANPDLAKFVVKGTKSGTGSHIIASFLNDAGSVMGKIDDFGGYIATGTVSGTGFVSGAGGRFKSGSGGGLETSTGKFFVESSNGWKSFHVLEYESVLASTYNAKSLVPKDYVDAKITQTITNGVTDKSPSEDAVFDAIDGVVKTIISDTPTSTNTGGVSEVLMHTYPIAGGKLPSSCMPNLKVRVSKSGTVGTYTLRVKVNTTNNFATATIIATYTGAANTNTYLVTRNPILISGNMEIPTSGTASLISDETAFATAFPSITYDTTVTQYWFVSLQNSDATDTTRIRSVKLIN